MSDEFTQPALQAQAHSEQVVEVISDDKLISAQEISG
jgi:hypothetical protein